MAELIAFPNANAIELEVNGPEHTDKDSGEPPPVKTAQYILELEHELVEHSHTICAQAIMIRRIGKGYVNARTLLVAVLLAFVAGWLLDPPPIGRLIAGDIAHVMHMYDDEPVGLEI
jgi:hypothetical protein